MTCKVWARHYERLALQHVRRRDHLELAHCRWGFLPHIPVSFFFEVNRTLWVNETNEMWFLIEKNLLTCLAEILWFFNVSFWVAGAAPIVCWRRWSHRCVCSRVAAEGVMGTMFWTWQMMKRDPFFLANFQRHFGVWLVYDYQYDSICNSTCVDVSLFRYLVVLSTVEVSLQGMTTYVEMRRVCEPIQDTMVEDCLEAGRYINKLWSHHPQMIWEAFEQYITCKVPPNSPVKLPWLQSKPDLQDDEHEGRGSCYSMVYDP